MEAKAVASVSKGKKCQRGCQRETGEDEMESDCKGHESRAREAMMGKKKRSEMEGAERSGLHHGFQWAGWLPLLEPPSPRVCCSCWPLPLEGFWGRPGMPRPAGCLQPASLQNPQQSQPNVTCQSRSGDQTPRVAGQSRRAPLPSLPWRAGAACSPVHAALDHKNPRCISAA